MSQLAAIRDDAAVQGLEFLLIGGNAIIAYGVERETADLDLMVRREQLAKWQELLKCHGYTVFHDGGNFMQFNPPADDAWAVDVMIVNDPTFGKMRAASQSIELWGEQWRIPSPAHLVALKLHALKHGGKHRQIRDFLDVVELVQRQRLDLNSPECTHCLPNMDRLTCIEKFFSPAPDNGAAVDPMPFPAPELEFPVNSDANWPQTLVGPEAMLLRCEANLRFRNSSPERVRQRRAAQCPVEFVLL